MLSWDLGGQRRLWLDGRDRRVTAFGERWKETKVLRRTASSVGVCSFGGRRRGPPEDHFPCQPQHVPTFSCRLAGFDDLHNQPAHDNKTTTKNALCTQRFAREPSNELGERHPRTGATFPELDPPSLSPADGRTHICEPRQENNGRPDTRHLNL